MTITSNTGFKVRLRLHFAMSSVHDLGALTRSDGSRKRILDTLLLGLIRSKWAAVSLTAENEMISNDEYLERIVAGS
jgi:hypothetical protein